MKIPAIQQLFLHTQSYVTPAMIADECPNDPGYWRYVERWNEILRAKEPPPEWDFAVSETIGLTRWGDDYNPGLCRFRSFTGTVDLHGFLESKINGGWHEYSINYPLCRLIADTLALKDAPQAILLHRVLKESCGSLKTLNDWMYPQQSTWLLFAGLLLTALAGDPAAVEESAVQMLSDEIATSEWMSEGVETHHGVALFSEETFDQLHSLWADMGMWCLAPFSELPVIHELMETLQPWRVQPFDDAMLCGDLDTQSFTRLREIEAHVSSFADRKWKLPPLGAELRKQFRLRQ